MTRLALVIVLCVNSACLPSPKPVVNDFYVLPARMPTPPPANATATLTLGRVSLPTYLERGEIATRSGTRISYSPVDRWAEPLTTSVPRLIAEDLAAVLAPSGLAVSTRAGDWMLVVDIARFELDASGSCVLDARWSLRDPSIDKAVASGAARYEERPSAQGGAAMAAALAATLDRLAGDVAAAVGRARQNGQGRPG